MSVLYNHGIDCSCKNVHTGAFSAARAFPPPCSPSVPPPPSHRARAPRPCLPAPPHRPHLPSGACYDYTTHTTTCTFSEESCGDYEMWIDARTAEESYGLGW